jgi:hypothetical protein
MQALSHCGCINQVASADFAGDVAVQCFELNSSLCSVHSRTAMRIQVPAKFIENDWDISNRIQKIQINSCDTLFVNDDVLRFYAVCLFTPCVLGRQMVTDEILGVSKLV